MPGRAIKDLFPKGTGMLDILCLCLTHRGAAPGPARGYLRFLQRALCPIGVALVCGVPPRVPMLPMWRPHPIFSFFGKRKDGGEKKKPGEPSGGGETYSLPRNNPCVAAGFDPLQEK